MPSTRFTKELRAKLTSTITHFSFEKIEKENDDRSVQLAEELYHLWVSPKQEAAMQSLPSNFFREVVGEVTLRTGLGYMVNLRYPTVKKYIPNDFPALTYYGGTSVAKWPEFSQKVTDLAVRQKTTTEEKKTFKNKTASYLQQFTIIEKFIEASPDLYKICKDEITKYLGRSPITAVAPVADEILCNIAKNRNEFRAGCV